MTIIEKIRAEVERRKKKAEHYIEVCKDDSRAFEYWSGERDVLELFEKEFLSTLESEKPVPADLEEAAGNYEKEHTYQRYDGGGFTPEYDATLAEAVIFGAKWQKERDEKELSEKIASAYQLGLADKEKQLMKDGLDAVKSGQSSKIEKTIAGVFVKYGMDRQKEQMMKEAVEGKVCGIYGNWVESEFLETPIGEEGDKVKLIIIKED